MRSTKHLLLTACFLFFLSLSCRSQNNTAKKTDYDLGCDLYWGNKQDSAFLVLNRYVNSNPADSFKKGSAYKYIGEIQLNIGDLYGAEESLTVAIHILDSLNEKHREELAIAYLLFGNVYLNLKLYDEAIKFYTKAMSLFKRADYLTETMNNKAIAFQKMKRYKEAIAIYDSILSLNTADQNLVARIIDNRARTKWLQDPAYDPLDEFRAALKIRIDSQNNGGLNASYAHFSDYYASVNKDSALWYANKMRRQATANQSPDDILEAIDKLFRLNNSPAVKEQLYEDYKTLNDSLQFSRDTTRNRFALIKYDFQKSKADNLTLQQDNTRQRLLLYGLVVLSVAIVTGLIALYNKRRKRMKQESENAIQELKLKTSKKVHDVVANGLYIIMNELEHGETVEKELLTNKIEVLYEKSRNISYEDVLSGNNDDNPIPKLLASFSNEQTKVIIVGDQQTFFGKISRYQKQELYLVLNEMMINMKKHSRAKNVVIHFKQEYNKGFILYKDDGVGFDDAVKFGNGLNNTVSRIKSINGEVNFGKSDKGGVSITINFPLE